jgi:hypothetical protein
MSRLLLFGVGVLLALCSCQQNTPKQSPEDNKQDSTQTNREVDLEYFSTRGFDNQYLESDSCKDGIQLHIADDSKSFYLNINNNVDLKEEFNCA